MHACDEDLDFLDAQSVMSTMVCMSSPLNPHRSSTAPRSSSPMSSPTPMHRQPQRPHAHVHAHAHQRHAQPLFPRSRSMTGSTSASGGTGEITPVESAMWRDRFQRRCAEKQRREGERRDEVAKRRGVQVEMKEDEVEATRRAELEDEEIFRRMVIHQRKKAEHAQRRSFEEAMGGSDDLDLDPDPTRFDPNTEEQEQWETEAAQAEAAEEGTGGDVDMDVDPPSQLDDDDMFDDSFDWNQVLAMDT